MRRDLLLPALLVIALTGLSIYATTGKRARAAELATTPAPCQPPQLIGRVAELKEASGLAASRRQPQVFWSHNDSAGPLLFAITADGKHAGRVRVAGATVDDWEAVVISDCAAGSCLYIGDIGDNNGRRPSITVYRTIEPSPNDADTQAAEPISATYPDGPQDAEALFAVGGALYLVTKGEGPAVRVYRFPSLERGSRVTLQLVSTLTASGPAKSARVTDAAASPSGEWVALRTNDLLFFYRTAALLGGKPGAPMSFDLRALKEPQGEGLAWADDRTLYLAGESAAGGTFARITCALPQ